jgi:hypothetical protein
MLGLHGSPFRSTTLSPAGPDQLTGLAVNPRPAMLPRARVRRAARRAGRSDRVGA